VSSKFSTIEEKGRKKLSRRAALSTGVKVAIGAVVAGVVAGIGGYYAGSVTAPVREVTRTVTSTVERPAAATTITQTVTRTVTIGAPPVSVEITLACDAGHNYLPWFEPDEAPEGGHYGQNQALKI